MSEKAKVYIVQEKRKWDPHTEQATAIDVSKAERHGEVVYLLPTEASPFNVDSEGLVEQIRGGLEGYVPDRDYILPLGNPILIGLVVALASEEGDRLRFLQWVGAHQSYVPVVVDLSAGSLFAEEE
jgi:hypothetical protein